MDKSLTFAEAMALDPSEVEVFTFGAIMDRGEKDWHQLRYVSHRSVDTLRACKFRRAHPKRPRVEEMAIEVLDTGGSRSPVGWMTIAIRAVCEYLRTSEAGHMVNHDLPGQVEREFLH